MWYRFFRGVFRIILKLFFRLKVEGLENLPQKSNFILIANHTSYLDPLVILAGVPQKISCIALRGLYRIFWLKWFLQKMSAFPSGSSSEKAVSLLMQNKNVGLFPEGGVSRDGSLREFRSGAALLAIKTGRPIVPCAIFGTHAALPKGAVLPKFSAITIKISKPIYLLKEFTDIIDDVYLQDGIFRVRNIIMELLNKPAADR
ncbi:MAG: lysophospholipid acyltransferase family protein [Candidatus Omnitrophota bacterium]